MTMGTTRADLHQWGR